jgi:Flp pilus assembly protein TadG
MKRFLFCARAAKLLRSFARNSDATAAVEAAIFAPFFVTLMLGITDLGSGMFVRMQINAATQAGAHYAVLNSCGTTCASGIKTAMNDAVGDSSFCSKATCTATITQPCVTPCTVTVSANYPFTPILSISSGKFSSSWTKTQTVSSTATVRIL